MAEPPVTVKDVFELPQGGDDESSPRWQSLREWMSREVKDIKTAKVPDLTSKVAELLNVPIPDILLTSWKKTNVLRELLEESKKSPETALHLALGEHTINSQHRPHIEVRIQKVSVKKLEFTLRLIFKLKGFVLKIQNGAVTEMETGTCEMQGTLEYQGLPIAEKKAAPIKLPGRMSLEGMRRFWEDDKPQVAAATPAAALNTPGTKIPTHAATSVAAAATSVAATSAASSRPPAAPVEPKPVAASSPIIEPPRPPAPEPEPKKASTPIPAAAPAKVTEDREEFVL